MNPESSGAIQAGSWGLLGYGRADQSVWPCPDCGAVVADRDLHATWHEEHGDSAPEWHASGPPAAEEADVNADQVPLAEFLLARLAEDLRAAQRAPAPSESDERVIDKDSVLADLDYRRRVVEHCLTLLRQRRRSDDVHSSADFADAVLKHLALPYADHEDYRQEWMR